MTVFGSKVALLGPGMAMLGTRMAKYGQSLGLNGQVGPKLIRLGPKMSQSRIDIGRIIKVSNDCHFCIKIFSVKGLRVGAPRDLKWVSLISIPSDSPHMY